MREETQKLFQFIEDSPCAYLAVCNVKKELDKSGYRELLEQDEWNLEPGQKYYVVRNDTSVIAFTMPEKDFKGFHIIASHSDAPSFKIKENPEMKAEGYVKLNVEKYGGMILSTWMDRCLSVAGRVFVRNGQDIRKLFVDVKRDLLLIPNLAIHMNRDMNKGVEYSVQKDMCPLLSAELSKQNMKQIIADECNIHPDDIISMDLFLYNRDKAKTFGAEEEFIAAPRLDDLQCVYASLKAMTEVQGEKEVAEEGECGAGFFGAYCPVMAIFDNEEVGSSTMQGADSTFLSDVLS